MSRGSFHYREVRNSFALSVIVRILQEASGPMTSTDIYEEAKSKNVKLSVGAITTCIDEIRKNTGYGVSPGMRYPDGKFRYYLIQAPGWQPRWKVNANFKVVPFMDRVDRVAVPLDNYTIIPPRRDSVHEPLQVEVLHCLNPGCNKVLPADHKGLPVCDEACRAAWKEKKFGGVKA